jgi:hypothetical protein
MKVQPKTEEQLAEEGLLPDGNYPFEVVIAENKVSKAGNDMIAMNLRFYGPDGRPLFIRDWIMESMGFKLLHFCNEVGIYDKYNAGEVTAQDCDGRQGYAKIGRKKDEYGWKNVVKDYGKPDETDKANKALAESAVTPDPDDDLPKWD